MSRELWHRVQCPTLFVYGKHSPLKPPEDQIDEILSHFSNLTRVELDSGHNPHQEMPDTLQDVLEDFYKDEVLP